MRLQNQLYQHDPTFLKTPESARPTCIASGGNDDVVRRSATLSREIKPNMMDAIRPGLPGAARPWHGCQAFAKAPDFAHDVGPGGLAARLST